MKTSFHFVNLSSLSQNHVLQMKQHIIPMRNRLKTENDTSEVQSGLQAGKGTRTDVNNNIM